MSSIELDIFYGIRTFSSIPVIWTDLAKKTIYKLKRWKRLNRPDQTRTKIIDIPMAYQFEGKIYAHPKFVKTLNINPKKDG